VPEGWLKHQKTRQLYRITALLKSSRYETLNTSQCLTLLFDTVGAFRSLNPNSLRMPSDQIQKWSGADMSKDDLNFFCMDR